MVLLILITRSLGVSVIKILQCKYFVREMRFGNIEAQR